jgi:dTDP-4-dehydrorhamnose reductase
MTTNILLTGTNGQVGQELQKLLPSLGELAGFDRQGLDLLDPVAIRNVIRNVRPKLIVNAAAYTAVDRAESDEVAAYAINAEAPRIMAEEAKKVGAAVIHYSTDYVFDGTKNSPYFEDDATNPISAYGRTKLAGEEAIRRSGVPHLILRTAWVYGTRGKNFLLTILRLASEREELRIVQDQLGAPTWCREIARGTVSVLKGFLREQDPVRRLLLASGTYNMTAAGTTNWYEFARAILEEGRQLPASVPWYSSAMNGRPLITSRILPISTDQYPTPACRPPYSVLSNARLNQTFGVHLPDWREQLHSAFTSVE